MNFRSRKMRELGGNSVKAIADKRTILVVDDTPGNLEVANNTLKDTYIIKIATNGARALDLAKVVPQPDLILLDVMMPEMDGYEVCIRLKSDPSTSDIPIIFLTGKIDAEDETRGLELGAIDYIHKPFSPLVVQARVRTHLALREAREQLVEEKRKVDRILANILPAPAVAEIKLTGGVIPRRFENVAVLFSDLVGFTNYCDQQPPEEVVRELGNLFVTFESCARAGMVWKKSKLWETPFSRQRGYWNPSMTLCTPQLVVHWLFPKKLLEVAVDGK